METRKRLVTRLGSVVAPATAAAGALVVLLGFAGEARADYLTACGDVWVNGVASCEVLPTETCTTECMPVAVETACASRLVVMCDGGCTGTADTVCRSECETSCAPVCTAALAEGPPNCMGLCVSGCSADCAANCDPGTAAPHCRSSCEQVCSSNCREKCEPAPDPTCTPTCTSSCWGSCEAESKMVCQLSCQSTEFTACETDVVNECKTECMTTGGGIFCDGQFMATGGNLQACADELNAEFGFILDVEASLHAEVDADTNGGFNCAIVRADVGGAGPPVGLILLAGVFAWRAVRAATKRARR